jgi:hypothetical protein
MSIGILTYYFPDRPKHEGTTSQSSDLEIERHWRIELMLLSSLSRRTWDAGGPAPLVAITSS